MAVSTRWNLLAGFSAAVLALTACGDSGGNNNEDTDGGANGGNGNASAGNNANDGENNGTQGEGGMAPMPVADLDDNVAGKGCSSDADCSGTGAVCADTIGGFNFGGMSIGGQPAEGGYCTGPCDDDSNCGAGGVCAGAFAGIAQGTCQKACDADSDCREADGYVCSDNDIMIPEGGIPMTDGGMTPMIPDQPSTCLPKPAVADLDDGVVGKPCTADAECTGEGGTCNTTVTTGGFGGMGGMMVTYPGGYCSGACTQDADCGATGECVGAIAIGPINNPGTCALRCANTKECGREGYRCAAGASFPGAPAGEKVCQPGAAPTATATFAAVGGSTSTITGTAKFSTTATGAQAVISLTNCPPGTYAFQIHAGSMCSNYGAVWDTARGVIGGTVTCENNAGTATIERPAADAATKWSLDESATTDVGGHTLLVYANPIGDAAPLVCGAITNDP